MVEQSYVELQRRDDTPQGHALRRYMKGHYLPALPDAAIEALLAHDPSMGASLQAHGGAIADVPERRDGVRPPRDGLRVRGRHRLDRPGRGRGPDRRRSGRCAGGWSRSRAGPTSTCSATTGPSGVRRAYPPAVLARLTALKDAVDPENVFHLNQNIRPSRRAATV